MVTVMMLVTVTVMSHRVDSPHGLLVDALSIPRPTEQVGDLFALAPGLHKHGGARQSIHCFGKNQQPTLHLPAIFVCFFWHFCDWIFLFLNIFYIEIFLFWYFCTPDPHKCKRQMGFYFPKLAILGRFSENKNKFENWFEHPGGVLIFKCVSNRVCEISVFTSIIRDRSIIFDSPREVGAE